MGRLIHTHLVCIMLKETFLTRHIQNTSAKCKKIHETPSVL